MTTTRAPRVAIVGSRPDPRFYRGLTPADDERRLRVRAFVADLAAANAGTVIVSGGAKGVDTWAEEAAADHGLVVVRCIPAWERMGKSASHVRNAVIVDLCDRLVAFWDGESMGTKNAVALARKSGKPVEVVEVPRSKVGAVAGVGRP